MLQVRNKVRQLNFVQRAHLPSPRRSVGRSRIGKPARIGKFGTGDTECVAVPFAPGMVAACLIEAAVADPREDSRRGRVTVKVPPMPLGVSQTGVSVVMIIALIFRLCEEVGAHFCALSGGGAAASRAPVRGRGLPRRRSRPRSVRRPRGRSTSSSGGGPGLRPYRPSSCAWRPKCRGR